MKIMVGKSKQRKHNRRFFKSSITILASAMKNMRHNRARLTVKRVAKDAGITRGAMYYHYKDLDDAIAAGEATIIDEFKEMLNQRHINAKNANRQVFLNIFILIFRHKGVFKHVCEDIGNQGLLYKLMEVAYSQIEIMWLPASEPSPRIGSERVSMYFKIVVEVICRWGQITNCDIDKAEPYIKKILRITENASRYCG